MRILSRALTWLKSRWRKNKWLLAYEIFNYVYDYPFYGWMIFQFGIYGAAVAASGSLAANLILFWWYDHQGIDWMSAQELRELSTKDQKAWYERLFVWFGKKKTRAWERFLEPVVYVLFLSRIDPLVVAVHFRREHFTGLKARDWLNILSAVAIANFWWMLQIGLVAEGLKFGWHYLSDHL